VAGQVDDLLGEIRVRAERQERCLITTLTQADGRGSHRLPGLRMGCESRLFASEIPSIERIEIFRISAMALLNAPYWCQPATRRPSTCRRSLVAISMRTRKIPAGRSAPDSAIGRAARM